MKSASPAAKAEPTPLPIQSPAPEPKKPEFQARIAESDSAIAKIDFRNLTYPLPRNWQNEEKEITLENGKKPMTKDKIGMVLKEVEFGDLTGDKEEEAIVTLGVITGGLTDLNTVYIFKFDGNQAKPIWEFETGDKGDGGLKDVFAENNLLVVELYGKDRYIFRQKETLKLEDDYETPVCCPKWFTRSKYKWKGSEFTILDKRETLDYTGEKL